MNKFSLFGKFIVQEGKRDTKLRLENKSVSSNTIRLITISSNACSIIPLYMHWFKIEMFLVVYGLTI